MLDPIKASQMPDFFPDYLPKLVIGRAVRHKRYGYYGLIVDFDMRCQAPDDYYSQSGGLPSKDQPWYHVLVQRNASNIYVPQEIIEEVSITDDIIHPLLQVFFDPVPDRNGHYIRNDEHWPGWNG